MSYYVLDFEGNPIPLPCKPEKGDYEWAKVFTLKTIVTLDGMAFAAHTMFATGSSVMRWVTVLSASDGRGVVKECLGSKEQAQAMHSYGVNFIASEALNLSWLQSHTCAMTLAHCANAAFTYSDNFTMV